MLSQDECPPIETPISTGGASIISYGGGRVNYSVAPNTGGDRQITITVGGLTYTVFQYGGAPPANDNFANAAALSGADGQASISVNGYNTNATTEQNEPAHDGRINTHSVWFKWTSPPEAGLHSFSTSGSDFDTVMAIY
ncbi:MAG: hypothetical protein ACR2L1_11620, partial [Pyrinomonadaceae bacterium]